MGNVARKPIPSNMCPLVGMRQVQPAPSHRLPQRHSTGVAGMGVYNTRFSRPKRSRVDGITVAVRPVHIHPCPARSGVKNGGWARLRVKQTRRLQILHLMVEIWHYEERNRCYGCEPDYFMLDSPLKSTSTVTGRQRSRAVSLSVSLSLSVTMFE